jgi:S-phase kinase-associated protein 1
MTQVVESGNYNEIDFKEHIVLQSNDSPPVEYIINRKDISMSGLIKDMLEDNDDSETIIPLPNVNNITLKYIIQYLEYHSTNKAEPIEKPLKGKLEDIIDEWDKTYIFTNLIKDGKEENHELLIDVIMGANFMNIQDLLNLTCAAIANMIKGKTPEQIRNLFNIENDFTPEEEEKIKEENRWCEEI